MEACYHGNSPLILVGQVDLRNNKMLQALINIRAPNENIVENHLKIALLNVF